MEEEQNQTSEQVEETTEPKGPINPMFLGGIVVVVLLVFGAFFLSQRNSQEDLINNIEESQNTTPANTTDINFESGDVSDETVDDAEESSINQQVVNLEAGSFYYAPNEIRVKKGQTVRVILTVADTQHDFNIDELGIKIPLTDAGSSTTVEFVADQAGEFEYYCSVGRHRELGQVGKLIVEE